MKCIGLRRGSAHSKIHAAYSPLPAKAFQAFLCEIVSPAWQSVALPAGRHSVNSSGSPTCSPVTLSVSIGAVKVVQGHSQALQKIDIRLSTRSTLDH